jgi:hypothetical protein
VRAEDRNSGSTQGPSRWNPETGLSTPVTGGSPPVLTDDEWQRSLSVSCDSSDRRAMNPCDPDAWWPASRNGYASDCCILNRAKVTESGHTWRPAEPLYAGSNPALGLSHTDRRAVADCRSRVRRNADTADLTTTLACGFTSGVTPFRTWVSPRYPEVAGATAGRGGVARGRVPPMPSDTSVRTGGLLSGIGTALRGWRSPTRLYECRQCGTTVDDATAECDACGSEEIASYAIS